jgi:hypothetical protein
VDPEERSLFARILDTATGTIGLVALVVVASAIGGNAYLLYAPNAQQAQAVSAVDAPVTTGTASAACQKEIATAAARGTPDVQSTITDQSSLQFEDQCVAAVLNPAVTGLGPNNPGSYMCVGKSAKVTVVGVGVVTETAVPDPAVPAGTCATVACSALSPDGTSNCFAASNVTNLNGNTVESDLAEVQSSAVSPDSGISSLTLNADGSIASEGSNATGVLDSSIGDTGISQSASGISSDLPESGSVVTGAPESSAVEGVSTPASGDAVQLPEIQVDADAAPSVEASAEPSAVDTGDVGSVGSPDVAATPVSPDASVPSPLPSPNEVSSIPADPDAAVEPTQSTVSVSDVGTPTDVDVPDEPSGNILERAAANVASGVEHGMSTVEQWLGITTAPQPFTPANIGIRG